MAERMANLDPALENSTGQSVNRYADGAYTSSGTVTAQTSPIYTPSQATPQPYYQFQPSNDVNANLGSGISTLSTPATQSYSSQTPSGLNNQQDEAEATEQAQDDAKRPRACEACRQLKVRCDQDPTRPDVPCKRCAKAGRACIITQPSRKRQKKADSRVAELEKKLDALTAVLNHRHSTGSLGTSAQMPGASQDLQFDTQMVQSPQPGTLPGDTSQQTDPSLQLNPAKRRRTDGDLTGDEHEHDTPYEPAETNSSSYDMRNFLHHISPDAFSRRITMLVPLAHGAELFELYNTQMIEHLPVVVFPKGTSAAQVFKEKPILYLAIISAASYGQVDRETSIKLQNETMGAIADCVARNGAKSLELIQAMQISALWYKPPDDAERTNFYQIVHMAAVMALDIGLGKRFNPRKPRHPIGKPDSFHTIFHQNSDSLEARRAWLGCYYLCATASMVLRRPNLVRWTAYMKECIEVLETSPEAYPSDKLLCQHIRIQHICEEIGMQFLMDDSTAQVSMNDPKVTYVLHVLENKLNSWKQEIPPELQDTSLVFFEHVTSLYLHEIALHFNHNIDDFRMPFTEESLKNVNNSPDALTQAQITAILSCLKAAHGILSTLLSFSLKELLAIPMLVFFVRCLYALVILIKMHVSVTTPGSELGKLMQAQDLKIEYYMEELIKVYSEVARFRKTKPEKIIKILLVMNDWFNRHKEATAAAANNSEQHPAELAGDSSQAKAGQEAPQVGSSSTNQSPLDMLSQVASGQQHSSNSSTNGSNTAITNNSNNNSSNSGLSSSHASTAQSDWSFNSPSAMNFRRVPQAGEAKFPSFQRRARTNTTNVPMPDAPPSYDASMIGTMSAEQAPGYGWGSGFEQAMDLTLGHMGDLQGDGLNSWFLGQNAAPFGYGDVNITNAPVTQWQ